MKSITRFASSSGILLLFVTFLGPGCKPLDTSNPIPVSLPELDCSPEGVADFNGKYVVMEGDMHTPPFLMCSGKICSLSLVGPFNPADPSDRKFVNVMVTVGEGPNTFKELPDQYTNDDFKFTDADGRQGGHTDAARVYGRFNGARQSNDYYRCELTEPIKIEKL